MAALFGIDPITVLDSDRDTYDLRLACAVAVMQERQEAARGNR